MTLCDGFSHIVLPASDLARPEKFYADVLGLENQGRNLVAEHEPNAMMSSDCR